MQRCSLMFGLFAAMLTAAGCCDNWGALGPEDLPQAGEVLTIDSPKRLLIREGETGYLGGTILVEEDGVLNLAVEGELSVAEEAGIETRGGRVAWTLDGILDGATFSLTNNGGGSIMLDAATGSINIGTLNILNGDQDINSDDESSLTWTGTGMRANNMNVHNYGGTTRITDAGTMQVNNMNLKEQSDTESGGLTLTCNDGTLNNMAAVANGSGSALDILLQGQSSWNDINVDTNYGGSVRIDVGAEATVSFEHLYVDCNGASHGRLSNGELINAGNLTVDTLLTPVGCIYEDITDPAGQSTWLVTFPGGETFTIINSGTLDMPLPL